jgi:tRNA modification GTPase
MFSKDDTIVAIATAPGRASIGVIRLSGPFAADITHKLITRAATTLEPRHATLARIRDAADDDAGPIDEVIVTLFPGPHSYTGDDVVEIAAHGSPVLLERIVASAVHAGARLAAPGEFTLRAFLNGRLDLVQAEAVADLVDAVTPAQARQAFDQLEGTVTREMRRIGEALFDLLVRLEASLDFPDEGYHFIVPAEVIDGLDRVLADVDALLGGARRGRIVREGRMVAIVGGTNVGKSSLFNALVGTDRAIVTAIAGTTRDLLTERCDIEGVPVTLIDTAGIRETEEIVEREGVQRARDAADVADLRIVVLDRSRPLREEDEAFIARGAQSDSDGGGDLTRNGNSGRRVFVLNKIDLPPAWRRDQLGLRGAIGNGAGPAGDAGGSASGGSRDAASDGRAFADVPGNGASRDAVAHGADSSAAAGGGSRPGSASTAIVEVSVQTGEGVARLRQLIGATLIGEERLRDTAGLSNVRHIDLLGRVRDAVARARDRAAEGAPEELALADLREAMDALDEITGKRSSEDVLTAIFSRFCIGK